MSALLYYVRSLSVHYTRIALCSLYSVATPVKITDKHTHTYSTSVIHVHCSSVLHTHKK